MDWFDFTLPNLAENLALDEALLLDAESGRGGEVLRVWEWPAYAVVLGAGGKVADDVDEAACAADGVPLARRSSGGGTVLLGPGCLLYALVLRYDRALELREIGPAHRWVLGRITEALTPLAPDITLAGYSDLTAVGRKFSGNAQQRKRDHLLYHGTLLYDFDVALLSRYLREPPKQPEYRAQRPHDDFVRNLPAGAAELRERLRAAWGAEPTGRAVPSAEIGRLVAEKYGQAEWVYRR
jgi:lipoate-protein ligase A